MTGGAQPRTVALDISTLAAEHTAAHPRLDSSQQRLALAILRLLAKGAPVGASELADTTGQSCAEVAAALDRLPMLKPHDQGQVTAYAGLTLEPTSHVLEVDGRRLYGWCALDTLLPELLGQPAWIRSTCPQTGTEISLRIDESGVHNLTPRGAAMTLRDLMGLDLEDVIGTFCCFVHFFASAQAAGEWAKQRRGSYIVTVAQGFEFGRLYNRDHFGLALEEAARSRGSDDA